MKNEMYDKRDDLTVRTGNEMYDKRDDFNIPIVNFQFICSNIPTAHS